MHLMNLLYILESFKLVIIILTAVGFENNFSSSYYPISKIDTKKDALSNRFFLRPIILFISFLLLRLENKPVFVNTLRTSESLLLVT